MKYDYIADLSPARYGGLGCAHCGKAIRRGDLHLDCPDCAAIFCESCVRDGTFGNHQCDDYDWNDE